MGIELQKVKRDSNLSEWAEMVRSCKNSGLTVKAWCLEQRLNEKTYYYRQKQVCNAVPAKMNPPVQFAEVKQPGIATTAEGGICIHIGIADIRVEEYADLDQLRDVLRIVCEIC